MFSFQSPPCPLTEVNLKDLKNNNNVELTAVQKNSCEGQITEEELLDAIKAFMYRKTSGLDGVPIEVYQTFFDVLRGLILK